MIGVFKHKTKMMKSMAIITLVVGAIICQILSFWYIDAYGYGVSPSYEIASVVVGTTLVGTICLVGCVWIMPIKRLKKVVLAIIVSAIYIFLVWFALYISVRGYIAAS